ncbi:MAG TPA: alkene reductase [Pyrinomonadaceae bacterium]|nr:alkene reductase [Pyrinomonadaceae bacterium]
MTTLFDNLKIGDFQLKNRIVMAPMTRSRADDAGIQPDFAVQYYAERASAGLIITEATNVSPQAKGYVRTPGIYTAGQIEAWRKIVEAVHESGGKIFLQIFHTGRIALPDFLPAGDSQPVAPSAVRASGQNYTDEGMKDFVTPRELSIGEIHETVKDFAAAAKNAVEKAGFDGVELHGANGYLVQQFLGTNTNLRTDEYGGSIEKRARFLFEILDAMIAEIGANRVGLRLSPGGEFNDIKESDADELYKYIVPKLNGLNLSYLHIGTFDQNRDWHPVLRPLYKGIYFAGVGFTKERAEKLLADGGAEAIVFGTSFLANPDLPERFRLDAPLNEPDNSTFYTPGEKGYTDYPTLAAA